MARSNRSPRRDRTSAGTVPLALVPEIEHWAHHRSPASLRITVSVDHNHCHRYAICEQEAPEVFRLTGDGRLSYDPSPDAMHVQAVRQAARVCPMQAIKVAHDDRSSS